MGRLDQLSDTIVALLSSGAAEENRQCLCPLQLKLHQSPLHEQSAEKAIDHSLSEDTTTFQKLQGSSKNKKVAQSKKMQPHSKSWSSENKKEAQKKAHIAEVQPSPSSPLPQAKQGIPSLSHRRSGPGPSELASYCTVRILFSKNIY